MKSLLLTFIFASSLFSSTDWYTNYHEAMKVAQEKNKRVYMLIVSDDCRWCKKFERTTLKDKKLLRRMSSQYVLLHLSRDSDYIPKEYKTTPIPRHYFLTSQGEEIFPVVGYRDVETFNSFLDTVDERALRMKKWD